MRREAFWLLAAGSLVMAAVLCAVAIKSAATEKSSAAAEALARSVVFDASDLDDRLSAAADLTERLAALMAVRRAPTEFSMPEMDAEDGGLKLTRRSGSSQETLMAGPQDALPDRERELVHQASSILSDFGPAALRRVDAAWFMSRSLGFVAVHEAGPTPAYSAFASYGRARTARWQLGQPEANRPRDAAWSAPTWDPFFREWIVSVAKPLDEGGAWMGNVGMDIKVAAIVAAIGRHAPPAAQDFILTADGSILAAGKWQRDLEGPNGGSGDSFGVARKVKALALAVTEDAPRDVTFDGSSWLSYKASLNSTGWIFIRLVPVPSGYFHAFAAGVPWLTAAMFGILTFFAGLEAVRCGKGPSQEPAPSPATIRHEAGDADSARLRVGEMRASFLSYLSHEIRTPATAIVGFAELLGARGGREPDAARRKDYASGILAAAEELIAAVEMSFAVWSTYGKAAAELPRTVPLGQIADPVLTSAASQAASGGINLVSTVEDEMGLVHCRPKALGSAIKAMVAVAVERTPPGGEVKTRVFKVDGDVMLEISDGGPMFSDDLVMEVFERSGAPDPLRFGRRNMKFAVALEVVRAAGGVVSVGGSEDFSGKMKVVFPEHRDAA